MVATVPGTVLAAKLDDDAITKTVEIETNSPN